jgi:dienelactone hydrolase
MVLLLIALWGAQSAAPQQRTAADRAQAVVAQLAAGDFAAVEAQFDDKVKAALPPGRLAATWGTLTAQVGALQKQVSVRAQDMGAVRVGIVTCQFERATLHVQVAFGADGRISGLAIRPVAPSVPYTAPPYADPASFDESGVTVGSGEWALPGTLTLPKGEGPFPVVVLVHGSGPSDRDETVGANKPFKDLALGLASRGVAVLRYDKRTKVHGAAMAALKDLTVKQEVIDDVIAAIAAVRANARVDPTRVFVLGHSLGGMLIPRVGAADASLAGLIVMAGAARPLEDAIVEQTKYLAMADGRVSPDEQRRVEEATKLQADVKALTAADAASDRKLFNTPASYWLDLRGYDPPAAAVQLTQPMLILQGGRDYQVTPEEFARWKQALEKRPNASFHLYPALNHLFIAGEGKSLPEEYDKAGHVDQQVIDDIAAWVRSLHR